MSSIAEQLKYPQVLVSGQQLNDRSINVPNVAGIYAWYFKTVPSKEIDINSCWKQNGAYLLYVGISPRKPPINGKPSSKGTLRKRISSHMRGNSSRSTLRYSIGCLLSQTLGIQLRLVGKDERFYFLGSEDILSAWLEENAFATWIHHDEPWGIEEEVISDLYLPLNLDHNRNHPFYETLSQARKIARNQARLLSVI